jgi:translation elongation factor EF-1alpha
MLKCYIIYNNRKGSAMTKLHQINMRTGQLLIHNDSDRSYAESLQTKLVALKKRQATLQPSTAYYREMNEKINCEYMDNVMLSNKQAAVDIQQKYKKELMAIQRFEDTYNQVIEQIEKIETLLGK